MVENINYSDKIVAYKLYYIFLTLVYNKYINI